MANLQYGDSILALPETTMYITGITDVVPVKFDAIEGNWVVCGQNDATHMLIKMTATDSEDKDVSTVNMIEIGKCKNLYLLADAIVE